MRYDGTGAYFLDKLEDGAWLLEVFPDAAVTDNLFGRNRTDLPRSTILPNARLIQVNLPGLTDFVALQVDELSRPPVPVVNRSGFTVTPGKYLLLSEAFMADDDNFSILMEALAASPLVETRVPLPATTLPEAVVRVDTFRTCTAGKDLTLTAEVITLEPADSVELLFFTQDALHSMPMTRVHGFTYAATISGKNLKAGDAGYAIHVARSGLNSTFPGNHNSAMISIEEKDKLFPISIVSAGTLVNLLDPATDQWRLNRQWSRDIDFKPSGEGADAWFTLQIRQLVQEDEENLRGPQTPDHSIRHAFADRIRGRRGDVAAAKYIVVECSSPLQRPFQVALVQDNGIALGTLVKPEPGRKAIRIRLSDLKPVPLPILPRPYPTFLPYYFPADPNGKLDMLRVEALILSFGPGLQPGEYAQTLEWEIGRIFLRK